MNNLKRLGCPGPPKMIPHTPSLPRTAYRLLLRIRVRANTRNEELPVAQCSTGTTRSFRDDVVTLNHQEDHRDGIRQLLHMLLLAINVHYELLEGFGPFGLIGRLGFVTE